MKLCREQIIAYSYKYRGDYNKVLKAISLNEKFLEIISDAITFIDIDYPVEFWDLQYPPLCIFYRGDKTLLKKDLIAVVGSRIIDEEIKSKIKKIVKNLNCAYDIVSGLAKGVDSYAQQQAIIDHRRTVAVLGNGINYCYPSQNQILYQEIALGHLVISEYPEFTPPNKSNFPFRNRIIAALAKKVIIPACKIRSGTMHTVDYSLELGKELYTLPLQDNKIYDGNNYLIEQGANCIKNENDIRSI